MTVKNLAKASLIGSSRLIGRYVPFSADELRTVPRELVPFEGDLPSDWGHVHAQEARRFVVPRVPMHVNNLLYTPEGMAWADGRLFEKYSIRKPSLRELVRKPSARRARVIDEAVVTQSETPYTFGDWTSQLLISILNRYPLTAPLVLPLRLYERSFVRRDLERLGIEVIPADVDLRIGHALVLPRTRPENAFTPADMRNFQRAFQIDAPTPRPGSIVYLSREGEASDSFERRYPSREVAEIVRGLGGRVVMARETSLDEYIRLAEHAETVVADHGSAICNILYWKPKRVVELFSTAWWNPYFLFFAHAHGVPSYRLMNIDDDSHLSERLAEALKARSLQSVA
ncbi:glycosyltransferase 61 family protein [Paludisphaera rhizosphaerae]|uniref:glycosyltransferase 61 family protein n=1 Tax=Paludisphaera rhizosphaerae TaxID=2711216 RepID=UPI0013EDCDCB|nr:glycosyltransferase 61 family protein [Paludisphaera rhizosphaerae]